MIEKISLRDHTADFASPVTILYYFYRQLSLQLKVLQGKIFINGRLILQQLNQRQFYRTALILQ